MLAGERGEVNCVRIETEDSAEFQQEPEMEVGEVALKRVKRQYRPFQPLGKPLLVGLILYHTEQHLAHEEGHCVFMNIPAHSHERVDADEVAGEPKIRLRVPGDLRLKNIQGQEKGHRRLGTHLDKEAPPSIFPADRVQDDGILADLGVADDYEFSLFAHLATTCIISGSLFLPPVKPLCHRPQSLATVRDLVLLLLGDVRRREPGIFIRYEYRIVAEASPPGLLPGDRAFHRPLELMRLPVQNEGNDAAEACPAADLPPGRLQSSKFGQHLVHIQIEVL